jgi:urease accessory protein
MKSRIALLSLAITAVATHAALAHPHHLHAPGDGGLTAGLLHPWLGLDHLLAMTAVGLLAAQIGGRALWALPAAFLGAMILGGALGMLGLSLPGVEYAIALSIVVLGVGLAIAKKWPLLAAVGVVAVCGMFHGHAHGTEMPALAAPAAYAIGFIAATAVLHAIGVAAGYFATQHQQTASGLRISGAAMSAAGLLILLGVL